MSTPVVDPLIEERINLEHLKILAICYYVMGGLTLFGLLVGGIYAMIGLVVGVAGTAANPQNGPPPAIFGLIFGIFGLLLAGVSALFGGLFIYSGRCLQTHRNRTLSLIAAGLICLSFPLGTVLGVFTFIVLGRESVVRLYQQQAAIPQR